MCFPSGAGTFRQLMFDAEVKGRGGKKVLLPKGTQVQIGEWALHMNPRLWGPDVETFNPDREFLPQVRK